MTIMEIKDWLTQHGQGRVVWEMQACKVCGLGGAGRGHRGGSRGRHVPSSSQGRA